MENIYFILHHKNTKHKSIHYVFLRMSVARTQKNVRLLNGQYFILFMLYLCNDFMLFTGFEE